MLAIGFLGLVSATTFGLVAQSIEEQRALCVVGNRVKVVPIIRPSYSDTYQTNHLGFIGTVVAAPFLRVSEGRMKEMCIVQKQDHQGNSIERTILLGEQFSPLLDFGPGVPQKMPPYHYGNLLSAIAPEESLASAAASEQSSVAVDVTAEV